MNSVYTCSPVNLRTNLKKTSTFFLLLQSFSTMSSQTTYISESEWKKYILYISVYRTIPITEHTKFCRYTIEAKLELSRTLKIH